MIRKFYKIIFVMIAFVGIQSVANAACTQYLNPVTCDTNTNYTVYGNTSGAIDPYEECFALVNARSGNTLRYVKYINFDSCDTSKRFGATPNITTETVCMADPDNSQEITYSNCEIASSYLCSVGGSTLPYGFTDVGDLINQKVSSKFLIASGCEETETFWLLNGNYAAQVTVCKKCRPSSTLVPSLSYNMQIPEMADLMGCTGFGSGYGCRYCGDSCSSGTWADVSGHDGYQWRTAGDHPIDSCDCGNEYRCAANYYGTPSVSGSSYSGCTSCPLVCDVQSTSTTGTTRVSGCCVAAGATSTDTLGAFRLKTAACATEN